MEFSRDNPFKKYTNANSYDKKHKWPNIFTKILARKNKENPVYLAVDANLLADTVAYMWELEEALKKLSDSSRPKKR